MLRRAIPAVILMVAASLGIGTQAAVASPVRPLAEVKILPNARIAADGATMTARVRIPVPAQRRHPVGGLLGATTQGAAEAGTELGLLPGTAGGICHGRQHVETYVLYVDDSVQFKRGNATVNAVIQDENNGLKVYATDTRTVRLR